MLSFLSPADGDTIYIPVGTPVPWRFASRTSASQPLASVQVESLRAGRRLRHRESRVHGRAGRRPELRAGSPDTPGVFSSPRPPWWTATKSRPTTRSASTSRSSTSPTRPSPRLHAGARDRPREPLTRLARTYPHHPAPARVASRRGQRPRRRRAANSRPGGSKPGNERTVTLSWDGRDRDGARWRRRGSTSSSPAIG